MKQKMFIHFDAEGDFLEVRFGKPTAAYYQDLGNDIFERRDEKTDTIKGYAFFKVLKKMKKQPKDIIVEVPLLNEAIVSS